MARKCGCELVYKFIPWSRVGLKEAVADYELSNKSGPDDRGSGDETAIQAIPAGIKVGKLGGPAVGNRGGQAAYDMGLRAGQNNGPRRIRRVQLEQLFQGNEIGAPPGCDEWYKWIQAVERFVPEPH